MPQEEKAAFRTTRSRLVNVAAAIALLVGHSLIVWAVGVALRPLASNDHNMDMNVYHAVAVQAHTRSGWASYPAGSLVAFVMPLVLSPRAVDSTMDYERTFVALSALYSGAIAVLVARLRFVTSGSLGSALKSAAFYTAFIAVDSTTLLWRYDLFASLTAVLGFYLVAKRRDGAAVGVLAFGALTKLYPGLILVVGVSARFVERRLRPVRHPVRLLFVLAGSFAVAAAAVAALRGDLIVSFLRSSLSRPLQIESVAGAGYLLVARAIGTPVDIVDEHMSTNLHAMGTQTLAALAPLAFVGLFTIVYEHAALAMRYDVERNGAVRPELLAAVAAILITTFLITNKVLSPQYMAWLAPFVALLRVRHAVTFLAIAVLTEAVFPFLYSFVVEGEIWSLLCLNLRNVLLCFLLVDMVRSLHINPGSSAVAARVP